MMDLDGLEVVARAAQKQVDDGLGWDRQVGDALGDLEVAADPYTVLELIAEVRAGRDPEPFRPLLAWAEACSQHYGMLRQEPPFTSTQALKDALASAYAALGVKP